MRNSMKFQLQKQCDQQLLVMDQNLTFLNKEGKKQLLLQINTI
jgi:hypothetical protein